MKPVKKPEVTIGLPVYNAAQFLEQAICSILNQTYSNFELLIVDDGSTDSSLQIIKSFNDNRIKLITDGFNKGLPYRLNQITKMAKGSLLARMDADDIMHKNRILQQVNILKNHPSIDVLGTNAYSINETNNIKGCRYKVISEGKLVKVDSFIHPTIMGRKKWFMANYYNEKAQRVEDVELWYRTSKKSNFFQLNEPLLFYREYGGDYYKKYFKSLKGLFSITKKLFKSNESVQGIRWFFSKYVIALVKAIIYYIFKVLGVESFLIQRRNILLNRENSSIAKRDLMEAIQLDK